MARCKVKVALIICIFFTTSCGRTQAASSKLTTVGLKDTTKPNVRNSFSPRTEDRGVITNVPSPVKPTTFSLNDVTSDDRSRTGRFGKTFPGTGQQLFSVTTEEFLENAVSISDSESVSWIVSTDAVDEDPSEYIQRLRKATKILWLYVAPVFLCIGTVGNVLCIVVMQSPQFRRTPSSLTLTLLALTDIGHLWLTLFRTWIDKLTDPTVGVAALGQVSCKIYIFWVYLFAYMSSWTLVLVNAERALSVLTPFKARDICSKRRMGFTWAIFAVIMATANAHMFWAIRTIEADGVKACEIKNEFKDYVYWSDIMLSSVIPSILIFVGNSFIAYKMTVAQARRKEMQASGANNPVSSTTTMLFVVCTVFVLTTMPITIFFLGLEDHFFPGEWDDTTAAEFHCILAALSIIYNLNTTGNFFLYLLSGRKFRAAFVSVICCKRNESKAMPTLQTTTPGDSRQTGSEGRV